MTWFDRHPGKRLLGKYADGELDSESRGRVYVHVIGCPRCRERVEFIRGLGAAAADLSHPRPPEDLLDQILARRADGERVILPSLEDVPERRPASSLRPLVATFAILVVGISTLIFFAPQATAGRSELLFRPVLPEAGHMVEVSYRPSGELADQDQLRLRLRWRAKTDDGPRGGPLGRLIEIGLVPNPDGVFLGTFELPRSAVLLSGSVEDLAGEVVDSRSGRLWDLLIRDADGRPSLEALLQLHRVLEPRSGLAALDAAREVTRLYPESAAGWSLLLAAERRALDRPAVEQRLVLHRRKFADLDRVHARNAPLSAEDLSQLVEYARRLDDAEAFNRLARELDRAYPNHPTAVRNRLLEFLDSHPDDPVGWLQALESEWVAHGPVSEFLLTAGVQAAVGSSLVDRIEAWADRYIASGGDPMWLVRRLSNTPDLAGLRIQLAAAELERLSTGPDEGRRLIETRSEASVRHADVEWTTRAALGRALLDEGRCADGITELQTSVRRGWSPELFGDYVAALIACDRREQAIAYAALIAVDPLTSPDSIESLRRRFAPVRGDGGWATMLDSARVQFRARVADLGIEGELLPLDLRLAGKEGTASTLGEAIAAGPALIVTWDRLTPTARAINDRLGELDAAAEVRLLVVTTEPPNPELEGYLAAEVEFALHHDIDHVIGEHTGAFGAPVFLVVDASGQVIFRPRTLDDAVRALQVATEEAPPMV